MTIDRFYGSIAGLGSTSGVRVVVGRWHRSPLGAFADVMLEQPDGHRVLIAPNERVAEFVADTYLFDETRLAPVSISDPTVDGWRVVADELQLQFTIGPRPPLGLLLRLVPKTLAASPVWNRLIDPVASRVLPGVRTRGTARSGRHEYYGAYDQRRIDSAYGQWHGSSLGSLAPVLPAVRFGFSSTPATPSVTSVITTVVSDS
ncbi:MAG: hypothetical protein M3Z00_03510 [Actinomycetota bacterium]|nr:hypothetical protein [Actinomycetota bacterium]